MREARSVGRFRAANETATRTRGTPTKVTESLGTIPYSRLAVKRLSMEAVIRPAARPDFTEDPFFLGAGILGSVIVNYMTRRKAGAAS
jgi:hypothetical protein